MRDRDSVQQRVGRFVALMAVVFIVSAVVVVTERLSAESLSMLIGLVCGGALMLPVVIVVIWLWRRQEARAQERNHAYASPPVVVVTPPALPGYGSPYQGHQDPQMVWSAGERKFTIVGGED